MNVYTTILVALLSLMPYNIQAQHKATDSVSSYRSKASSLLIENSYAAAMEPLLNGISLLEQEKKRDTSLAWFSLQLAICYDYYESTLIAKKYFKKAEDLYKNNKNEDGLAQCNLYIGDLLEDEKNDREALVRFQLAYQHFKKKNDTRGQSLALENIGSIYENKVMYDSARYFYATALSLAHAIKDSAHSISIWNNIGDSYYKQKRYDDALQAYQRSLSKAQQEGEFEETRGNYKDLGKTYEALGDFKNAYTYLSLFFASHKKLKLDHKIDDIILAQERYITSNKNYQIKQLESEQKLTQLRNIALYISLFLLISILFISFLYFRSKIEKTKALNRINESLMKAEILNHQLQQKNLEKELDFSKREIEEYVKIMIQKTSLVNELYERLEIPSIEVFEKEQIVQKLTTTSLLTEDDWKHFKVKFEQAFPGFFARLKATYADLSPAEVRLAAMIKLNLTKEDMARILAISPDSVKKAKSRLKKKLAEKAGQQSGEIRLTDRIAQI
jgi:tetratricopeptide (TPR) repeat protein